MEKAYKADRKIENSLFSNIWADFNIYNISLSYPILIDQYGYVSFNPNSSNGVELEVALYVEGWSPIGS